MQTNVGWGQPNLCILPIQITKLSLNPMMSSFSDINLLKAFLSLLVLIFEFLKRSWGFLIWVKYLPKVTEYF